jgi:hypothetical protein
MSAFERSRHAEKTELAAAQNDDFRKNLCKMQVHWSDGAKNIVKGEWQRLAKTIAENPEFTSERTESNLRGSGRVSWGEASLFWRIVRYDKYMIYQQNDVGRAEDTIRVLQLITSGEAEFNICVAQTAAKRAAF